MAWPADPPNPRSGPRLSITVRLDRRSAEALALELRMLSRARGLSVERVDVAPTRPAAGQDAGSSPSERPQGTIDSKS